MSRVLSHLLPWVPRPIVGRVARRYVAGATVESVIATVRRLQARGVVSTVDLLGENVGSPEEARQVVRSYCGLIDELRAVAVPSHVSVKLTHLGLRLDQDLARTNAESILRHAEERGATVCIDMEDSSTTDATLRIFRSLQPAHPRLEMALQAYLRRSRADLESLLALRPRLRICKGIYSEPAALAFQEPDEIRKSFLELVRILIDGGGEAAIATHDRSLIDECFRFLAAARVAPSRFEFQMLLGVGEEQWPTILSRGAQLRIYCPFGPHWYEYSLRRLRENPRIISYVVRDLWRRLRGA